MIDLSDLEIDTEQYAERNKLIQMVDDILPDGFEIYELENDDSVYFSKEGYDDVATAEVRYTTPRERGTDVEENSTKFWLSITIAGPDLDNVSTWFSLESCIESAVKQLNRQA